VLKDTVWLLAHAPALLQSWFALRQQLQDGASASVEATAARILGSRWIWQHAADAEKRMSQADEAKTDSEQQAVITLTAQLTRQPERVSALDLQPLAQAGWSHARQFSVIQAIALANWNSRLFYACGEAS
jgi:alkylhydroperoxidase family enzyme